MRRIQWSPTFMRDEFEFASSTATLLELRFQKAPRLAPVSGAPADLIHRLTRAIQRLALETRRTRHSLHLRPLHRLRGSLQALGIRSDLECGIAVVHRPLLA